MENKLRRVYILIKCLDLSIMSVIDGNKRSQNELDFIQISSNVNAKFIFSMIHSIHLRSSFYRNEITLTLNVSILIIYKIHDKGSN